MPTTYAVGTMSKSKIKQLKSVTDSQNGRRVNPTPSRLYRVPGKVPQQKKKEPPAVEYHGCSLDYRQQLYKPSATNKKSISAYEKDYEESFGNEDSRQVNCATPGSVDLFACHGFVPVLCDAT